MQEIINASMVLYVPYRTQQSGEISSGGKQNKTTDDDIHILHILARGGVIIYTWYQLLVVYIHLVQITRIVLFSFVPCFLPGPDCALLPTVSTISLFSVEPCFLPGTRYEKLRLTSCLEYYFIAFFGALPPT